MKDELFFWQMRASEVPPLRWGRFRPFRVRFKMGSPVCITTPWISFDGLVAHLRLMEVLGNDYFLTPKKLPISEFLTKPKSPLPLKKTGPIFHASVSQFIPSSLKVAIIYKRFEPFFAASLKKRKIPLGSGEFRSYILREPYVPAREVVFYANGDMDIIKRWIENYLVGLGNDVRIGFGIVRDVLFEPMDEDFSIIADGIAMRPIPTELCSEYDEAFYLAYRPPYWDPRNVCECVPPGGRCKLKFGGFRNPRNT